MKLILIRGLPGTGKTSVAEILKKELENSEVINVDNFKLEAMNNGENFESAKKFAYEETLKKLYEFYLMEKDFVIIDEIFCDREFVSKLYSFINKTKSKPYWFRLLRKLKNLLEVEKGRNRKIKNNIEDFKKLKKDIESLKLSNEGLIVNEDLEFTVGEIKSCLK